jgi:hypothetical protein
MNLRRLAFAAAFLCGLGATSLSGEANAQGVEIKAGHSGKCLDSSGTDSGSNVHQYDCHGRDNQKWLYVGGQFIDQLSGNCLDATANGQGSNVTTHECHGGDNQKWRLDDKGHIISVSSGRCLDVAEASKNNGGNVHIWDCLDVTNQVWNSSMWKGKWIKVVSVTQSAESSGKSEPVKVTEEYARKVPWGSTVANVASGIASKFRADDVYMTFQGRKVWPLGEKYHSMERDDIAQMEVKSPMNADLSIELFDWDVISDDSLGKVVLSPQSFADGMYCSVLSDEDEGSSYRVCYQIYTRK